MTARGRRLLRLFRSTRVSIGALALTLLLTLLIALSPWSSGGPVSAKQPAGTPPAGERPGFLISYAGAADALEDTDKKDTDENDRDEKDPDKKDTAERKADERLGAEAKEQLRDWMRVGLAAELELDTPTVVGNFYDTLPVRDEGFNGLVRQPVGSGRSLFADGVLHLLVPHEEHDEHWDRTVGLLLDQYRTDSGADPEQVRLHRYAMHPDIESVHVESDDPVATDEFRDEHGYVRMRIDTPEGLTAFLAGTRALSTVEIVGGQVWAGGWKWEEGDGKQLSREDVAVLQRGYAPYPDGPPPGFSLDPTPVETVEDLAAVVPDLSDDLLQSAFDRTWGEDLLAELDRALFGDYSEAEITALGLPADRAQLWALSSHLTGRRPYSQARYDGGLGGTEVGMTLFYTDKVAKDWVAGVGSGVPGEAVEGFVPDTEADPAWSHCEPTDDPTSESGRLWFGQNDTSYSFHDDRISIGAQPTRLFARSDGADGGEVEPSYHFGRALRWWDRHYQAVADYEPQYQRLDHIMRWSAALEWLQRQPAQLPPSSGAEIRGDLRFADWYRSNDSLRERAPISWVAPPSAQQESLITEPSERFEQCGSTLIGGGVALADRGTREARADAALQDGSSAAGPGRRAGSHEVGSSFDHATGTGSGRRLTVDSAGQVTGFRSYRVTSQDDGTAAVRTEADRQRDVPFGSFRELGALETPRVVTSELLGDGGDVALSSEYQGLDHAGITAAKPRPGLVTVDLRRGPVARTKILLESLRNQITSGRGDTPVAGMSESVPDGDGDLVHRVGDGTWLRAKDGAGSPPDGPGPPSFRLGVAGDDGPRFFTVSPVPGPSQTGRFKQVTPRTEDSGPITTSSGPPPGDARPIPVTTPDGTTGTVYWNGDRVWAAANDPVLGFRASAAAAALLGEFPRVEDARQAAIDTGDGLERGVPVVGGAVLASANGLRVAPGGHPWAAAVRQATLENPRAPPSFKVYQDFLVWQKKMPLRTVPGTLQRGSLGTFLDAGNVILLDSVLRATLPEGPVLADTLAGTTQVTVTTAEVTSPDIRTDPAAQPDVWVDGDTEWSQYPSALVGGGPGDVGPPEIVTDPQPEETPAATPTTVGTPAATPTTVGTPAATPSVGNPIAPVTILLVCSQDDEEACAA